MWNYAEWLADWLRPTPTVSFNTSDTSAPYPEEMEMIVKSIKAMFPELYGDTP